MSAPLSPPPPSTAASEVAFLLAASALKQTPRTGWTRFPPLSFFPSPPHSPSSPLPYPARVESVADHSYLLSLFCSLALPPVDAARAARMALFHDLAEARVGDITPPEDSGVSRGDKRRMEEEAMSSMLSGLGSSAACDEIRALWEEYEAQATPVARFVKDCDRLEMVLQAVQYERANPGLDLEPFFESTEGKAGSPQTKAWDAEIRKLRPPKP